MAVQQHSPHILLIAQEAENQTSFKAGFEKAGWVCTTVSDLEAAVQVSGSAEVDLVLTDYVIPGFKGPDIVKRLKDSNPNQAVIVVTASATVDDAVELIKAGALDLISMPIEFGRLEQRLTRSLSLMRKQEWQRQLFRHILTQKTSYKFVTKDVVNEPLPIMIIAQLHDAGILSDHEHLRISLVLQEVFANSLEHGNLELKSEWRDEYDEEGIDTFTLKKHERLADPKYADRLLEIETEYNSGVLTISIQDHGPGFDYEKYLKESLVPDDPLQFSGRGNLLITQGVDSFEYSDGGRRIKLVKSIKTEKVES